MNSLKTNLLDRFVTYDDEVCRAVSGDGCYRDRAGTSIDLWFPLRHEGPWNETVDAMQLTAFAPHTLQGTYEKGRVCAYVDLLMATL